jgi:hypothetical protein
VTHDLSAGVGDLSPGARVAGYEIFEQVGRGGMAVVYRAHDLRLNRTVALKVLAPALREDEAFRERFMRESRAAARVEHPHIIPVFDAGEVDGLLFIAMRYVGGGDVRRLLDAEGRLGPERVAGITAQVASALDAAHAHGLVHRDVKPGNMLIAESDDGSADYVYLADFGLSKHSLTPSTLTSTGQFMGTLDYVAPEQIQGQPVDGRADQYGLACTVVEMLAGSPPFRRDETMALLWAQLEAPPPRLTLQRPDLPPAVDGVITRALAKSPADRFPTCAAFAESLRAASDHSAGRSRYPAHARPDEVSVFRAFAGERGVSPRGGDTVPGHVSVGRVSATRLDAVASQSGDKRDGQQATQRRAGERHDAQQPPDGARRERPGSDWRSLDWGRTLPHVAVRRRSVQRQSRRAALVTLVALAGLACVAGIGYKLFYHGSGTPKVPPPTPAAAGEHRSPAATVRAYFAAINDGDYIAAWKLCTDTAGETFQQFETGFAGTAQDTVRIGSVDGDVVNAQLIARQTDGTIKYYRGTYTVSDGLIVAANVHRVT